MAEEANNSIWDDQSWLNFTNLAIEDDGRDKGENEKLKLGETSKLDTGNKTNGDKVEKVNEATAVLMPPPPPPPVNGKGRKRAATTARTSDGGAVGDREAGEHELHIWTERERRKKMRNMFQNLHALLTHLPPKADKTTIVDEAVTYIKKLQETLKTLQQKKLERLYQITAANNYPINHFIGYNNFPFITTQQKLPPQSREAFLAELGSSSGNNNTTPIALPNQGNIASPPILKTWTSSNLILNVFGKDAHINVCCVKKPCLLTAISYVMEKHKLEMITAQVSSDVNQCMYMIHAQVNGAASSDQFAVEEIFKQAAAEIMMWINA